MSHASKKIMSDGQELIRPQCPLTLKGRNKIAPGVNPWEAIKITAYQAETQALWKDLLIYGYKSLLSLNSYALTTPVSGGY